VIPNLVFRFTDKDVDVAESAGAGLSLYACLVSHFNMSFSHMSKYITTTMYCFQFFWATLYMKHASKTPQKFDLRIC